jgi:hypothetical protein
MNKLLIIITISFFSFKLFSQSLNEINKYFEKFEYKIYSELLNEYSKKNKVSIQDIKKLAYSYYLIGDYKSSYPIVDSIINLDICPEFFHFIHGEMALFNKDYTKAKASFKKCRAIESTYLVDLKIKSADLMPSWKKIKNIQLFSSDFNSSKANISGGKYGNRNIIFSEYGIDSVGKYIQLDRIGDSELLFMRPLIQNSDG